MKYILFVCLLLATHICTAQPPFADGKNIHTRTILDGKATILLPDDFSYGRPFIAIGESEFINATSYSDQGHVRNVYCYLYNKSLTEDELYQRYIALKKQYFDKYVLVLRDEFVPVGNNSYFLYECRLKDEFYRKAGEPAYEIEDTAVTGEVVPNYFCFYVSLNDGSPYELLVDYQGDITDLEDFRRLWAQIKESFRLVEN